MGVVNGAHSDGQNQQFGILGVIGTLGTADVQGTAPTLPIGVNKDTGAMYVQDLSGVGGTTNVQGSVSVTSGSIAVTAGTIGTIGNVGQVHNAGTIAGGTIGQITNGSIVVTTGTVVNNGGTAGTVTGVGVISALTSGTVSVNTTGTITSGSISVIAGTIGQVHNAGTIQGGTLDVVSNLTNGSIIVTTGTVNRIVGGTITNSGTTTGVGVVTTVSNITNGTIRVTAGTMIQTIGTVNSGTMNTGTLNAGTINAGTINSGTINAGTFRNDGRPARNVLSFATTIVFGGSAFATLVGSAAIGAGTSLWVNDVSIVNNGGTQKYGLVFGSAINGSAVIAKGQFGPQGGIQKSFPLPVNAGMTNFDLNAWAEGAGTADFVVSYFISA